MRQGQDIAASQEELHGILRHLEAALLDIDRLQLMVVGAQLSHMIEEIRTLIDV